LIPERLEEARGDRTFRWWSEVILRWWSPDGACVTLPYDLCITI